MRLPRIIRILLAGLLILTGACGNPATTATAITPTTAGIIPDAVFAIPAPEPTNITPEAAAVPEPVLVPSTPPHASVPDPVPVPGLNEVWLWGNEYRPSTLVVAVGTTVTWVGKDAEGHDVESDIPGLFLACVAPGTTFNYTFNQPGTYGYHCCCGLLNGQIIVQ